jgi:hypothetical protein
VLFCSYAGNCCVRQGKWYLGELGFHCFDS